MSEPLGYVIVLGAGLLQIPLIKEIKNQGGYCLVVDKNSGACGVKEADYFVEASTKNVKEIISQIDSLPFKSEITHCVTLGTDMTPTVACLNEHLGLDGLSLWQSEVTSHKSKMRFFLEGVGLLQPNFYCSRDKSDIYDWLARQTDKKQFVLKPVDNMGARGVIYFEEIMDVSFVFELAQRESASKEVMVEDYIEGDEISVDALVYEGECFLTGVADRVIQRQDEMYFIEMGHNMPTQHKQSVVQTIKDTMQTIADALGSSGKPYHGALKGDLKYTIKKEIIVGEVASRLSGGFMSTHTFPYSTEVNLMKLYLDLITRNKTSFFDTTHSIIYKSVCIERSIVAQPGELKVKPDLTEEFFANEKDNEEKLCDLVIQYSEGDIIEPIKSNVGKYAHAIIKATSIKEAEKFWERLSGNLSPHTEYPSFESKELRKQAIKKFSPKYCWVCKVCDGINCASSVPGMGGIANMQTFQENTLGLRAIHIIPRYLDKDEIEQTSDILINTKILGVPIEAPVLTAPITGSITNMGGSISEWEYAFETSTAAKKLGLIPTFGDGASFDKYWIGLKMIQKFSLGFPVFKPRKDLYELTKRIHQAELMGAQAWGMDVDAIWFKTMQAKAQKTQRKRHDELVRLKNSSSLPFFLKGIMSISDAEIACESGAAALIVSNHGGRVFDGMPSTVEVLPSIANFVEKNYPSVEVLVDGGIRSGSDIFKMMALGAKAVLIGRPIVIAAVGYARFGVHDVLKKYIDEFKVILKVMGLSSLNDIQNHHIT